LLRRLNSHPNEQATVTEQKVSAAEQRAETITAKLAGIEYRGVAIALPIVVPMPAVDPDDHLVESS